MLGAPTPVDDTPPPTRAPFVEQLGTTDQGKELQQRCLSITNQYHELAKQLAHDQIMHPKMFAFPRRKAEVLQNKAMSW